MIKAVIFDVDGTLVDSVDAHARSWWETLSEFGCDVDYETVRHQIGKGGDKLMEEFLSAEQIQREGEEIEEARKRRFQKEHLDGVTGFPKVRKLFERILEDDRQIALASSASGEELSVYKEKAKIVDLVEEETSKDDVEESKPEPDIFSAALARLDGVSASEAVIVGDTPWDAIAGVRAGLKTIGVLCGGFDEAELREAGCVAIYDDPADLLRHYDSSPLVVETDS